MKNKINISKIFLYLYAFILLYMPNLSYYIKINSFILYLIPTMLYILKYLIKRDNKFFKIFQKKPIFIFIILNLAFTIYYAFRTMMAGTAFTDFYNLRLLQNIFPIFILIGCCIVYHELDNFQKKKKDKYKFIINVAIIQSLIAVSMIFLPSFRNVAYNIFNNGSTEVNIYIVTSRIYGICDGNYTYSFQIIQSFLALFSLAYAYFYKEKRYALYSIFILISSILNGRTGLIIFFIGCLMLLLYIAFFERKIGMFFKYMILGLTSVIIILFILYKFVPNTYNLIVHAKNDFVSFINENDSTTETFSLVNSIILPETIGDTIFGRGYRIYGNAGISFNDYRNTDIGFVNDIFMAGIFSILLLYMSYIQIGRKIIKQSKKNNFKFERFMTVLLLVCVICSNIKGEVFRSQIQIATILIILLFMLFESVEKCENIQ